MACRCSKAVRAWYTVRCSSISSAALVAESSRWPLWLTPAMGSGAPSPSRKATSYRIRPADWAVMRA